MPRISISQKISKLDTKINHLETLVKRGFVGVRADTKTEINRAIDEVGIMVKAGFDGVDDRFKQVDERFEQVEQRFIGVDQRFDKVDGQLGSINRRLDQAVYQPELHALETRVTILEQHTGLTKK